MKWKKSLWKITFYFNAIYNVSIRLSTSIEGLLTIIIAYGTNNYNKLGIVQDFTIIEFKIKASLTVFNWWPKHSQRKNLIL